MLVGIASWLAVAALWWLLVRHGKVSTKALLNSVGTVALVGAVALGVTLSWIRHNVNIYRERGPRKGRPDRAANRRADRLGRELTWDLAGGVQEAKGAGRLVVELAGDEKLYRSVPEPAARWYAERFE